MSTPESTNMALPAEGAQVYAGIYKHGPPVGGRFTNLMPGQRQRLVVLRAHLAILKFNIPRRRMLAR